MSTTSDEALRIDDELPAPKTELGRVQLKI